jgi:hypothetical protein
MKLIFASLLVLLLTGCTLRTPTQLASNIESSIGLRETFSTVGFNCFGFNVTGPSILVRPAVEAGCTSTDDLNGRGYGLFSRPIPRGSALDIWVPPGRERTIGAYALEPANEILECGATALGVGPVFGHFVGETTTDVFKPFALTMDIDYVPATPPNLACPYNYGAEVYADMRIGGGSPCAFRTASFVATATPETLISAYPVAFDTVSAAQKYPLSTFPASPTSHFVTQCQQGSNADELQAVLVKWHLPQEIGSQYDYMDFEFNGRAGKHGTMANCDTNNSPPAVTADAFTKVAIFKHSLGQWVPHSSPLVGGAANSLQTTGNISIADHIDPNGNVWFMILSHQTQSTFCSSLEINYLRLTFDN